MSGIDLRGGPIFETRALAIQAAVAQMGIVIIDPRFIESELAAGQLAIPFPIRVALDTASAHRSDSPSPMRIGQ